MNGTMKRFLLATHLLLMAAITPLPVFSQEMVAPADTTATQSVITDQISAFKAMDHGRAYSHAAPNIKTYFDTVEKFIGMVKGGYGALYAPDAYVYGRNMQLNGEIYQEVIVTDSSGKQWQAVYTLRQQADGSWKITGVKMNPYTGAST